ncbi:MAG TPA: hypothetical protein DCE71_00045 [Parachlamydiales bacterium]|nr:hypothetical protein [Parachlamydiales bacterium]
MDCQWAKQLPHRWSPLVYRVGLVALAILTACLLVKHPLFTLSAIALIPVIIWGKMIVELILWRPRTDDFR